MASSYLVLINNVLRDLNEVELTSSNFSSSRGIQTAVKDYVNRAIDDIINAKLSLKIIVTDDKFRFSSSRAPSSRDFSSTANAR